MPATIRVRIPWGVRNVTVTARLADPDENGVRQVERVDGHWGLRLNRDAAIEDFGLRLLTAAVTQYPQATGCNVMINDRLLRGRA